MSNMNLQLSSTDSDSESESTDYDSDDDEQDTLKWMYALINRKSVLGIVLYHSRVIICVRGGTPFEIHNPTVFEPMKKAIEKAHNVILKKGAYDLSFWHPTYIKKTRCEVNPNGDIMSIYYQTKTKIDKGLHLFQCNKKGPCYHDTIVKDNNIQCCDLSEGCGEVCDEVHVLKDPNFYKKINLRF